MVADSANIKSASGGQIVANSKAHMTKVVLKEHLVLTLFRDEYDLLHEDYQLYLLPSILESKELVESGRAKQKYADLEYNVAKQVEKMISYLYTYLKKGKRAEYVSFVDPGHIPTCGVDEEGSKLSQHIAAQLKVSNGDNICFIPYNTGGVKIYNASRGISKGPGVKQLTGNFKQNGGVEYGYCVMQYMKEIVLDEDPQLERKFAASKNKQYYNQSQYDEVRSEWSEFVYFYVGA